MICCERNNVYNIFQRCKIDIILLKRISQVLNHNFFEDLAKDEDLIIEDEETEEEKMNQKAVYQFFDVVPDVLNEMGLDAQIMFTRLEDHKDFDKCPTPDFALVPYFITLSIGNTMKERIGENPILPISVITNEDGCEIEVCQNKLYNSVDVNIKLDYKTREEWYKTLIFAFETYQRVGRR